MKHEVVRFTWENVILHCTTHYLVSDFSKSKSDVFNEN